MANKLGHNAGGVKLAQTPFGNDSSVTTAMIQADAVTNAKLADMAQSRIKGRAAGAGTGNPTDLTPDQANEVLGGATMAQGTALGNSNPNLTVAGGNSYSMPVSTLTANHYALLDGTGATEGEIIRIIRRDTSAFTYEVYDQGGVNLLYTFPASAARAADFRFNGGSFVLGGHCGIS